MRKHTDTALVTLLAGVFAVSCASPAAADVTTDHAAAILVFPRILSVRQASMLSGLASIQSTDTLVQISNTTNEAIDLHCFYINANSHCSLSGRTCAPLFGCPLSEDICLPGWSETDFYLTVTAQQPLAWRASTGLSRESFPLDGVALRGPQGQSNAGSAVPPVAIESLLSTPEASLDVFVGELKCVVVDAAGRAVASNAVKGEATVVSHLDQVTTGLVRVPTVEKYNAIGVQAIDGDVNGDGVLELGGDANEYNGCPSVLIVDHFFDDARSGVIGFVSSELTLVPCAQDLRAQIPGSTTAQFLVFNEFEQRFSTSRAVDCYFRETLSRIDTPQSSRSIFNAAVAGTLVGQTRVRGVSGGLLGVLAEISEAAFIGGPIQGGLDSASNLHVQGDRETADRIVLP